MSSCGNYSSSQNTVYPTHPYGPLPPPCPHSCPGPAPPTAGTLCAGQRPGLHRRRGNCPGCCCASACIQLLTGLNVFNLRMYSRIFTTFSHNPGNNPGVAYPFLGRSSPIRVTIVCLKQSVRSKENRVLTYQGVNTLFKKLC